MGDVCSAGGGRGRLVLRALLVVLAASPALMLAPAARALSVPHVYWANFGSNTIGRANLDGSGVNQSFIGGASGPFGVAVDGQHIYWANRGSGTIGRANLDGTGVNQHFITGASQPLGVAVNGQRIYWANFGSGTIGEANLDGSGVDQSFITGASGPDGVTIDGRHIYWANYGNGSGTTIGKANLDGTGIAQSFITGASQPVGLAVDGKHIYWTNDGSGTIGEANLDGTDPNQGYIAGLSDPEMVAVDGQHIYWADFGSGKIGEASPDGTGVDLSFATGASLPIGMAVSVPVAQVSPGSPPAFATTPKGTLSEPDTLTISNPGQRDLSVSGMSFTGADPGDFVISSNSCLGDIAPGESCQLTVSFAPQAPGSRTATLQISTNDYANSPLQVSLSGAGGSLPQGPTGPQGNTGAAGSQGTQGPAGQVELLTCRTIVRKVKGKRRKVSKCSGRLVSGTINFTTAAGHTASIFRGQIMYASGVNISPSDGRVQLLVSELRPLYRGRYTLTLEVRRHRQLRSRRETITIA